MSILVSIVCITYNHEDFIADAIDSFLMQQTNFKFEILIHDDASTDRTADIIKAYEKKYPHLIKPIYQIENQYSKGGSVETFNFERAKGKYIAQCEGDDYWTDPHKLQKQIDYLENHPNCSLVFHSAMFINEKKQPTGTIARIAKKNKIVGIGEIVTKANPNFIPTASRVYRRKSITDLPPWYLEASIGDFPLALLIAKHGYFYYIDEIMSVYRTGVKGSWSNRMYSKEATENAIKINKECIQILDDFNIYTNFKYKQEIEHAKSERYIRILLLEKKIKDVKATRSYKNLNVTRKISMNVQYYCPRFYKSLGKLKRTINKWELIE